MAALPIGVSRALVHQHATEVRVGKWFVGSDSEPTYIVTWEPDTWEPDDEDEPGEQEESYPTSDRAFARASHLLRRRPDCCKDSGYGA
jgi:hypothetical protein